VDTRRGKFEPEKFENHYENALNCALVACYLIACRF